MTDEAGAHTQRWQHGTLRAGKAAQCGWAGYDERTSLSDLAVDVQDVYKDDVTKRVLVGEGRRYETIARCNN